MEQIDYPFGDSEQVLAQFNRLIQEILRGTMNRNCFRPWEIRLLLDIEKCTLRDGAKRETLRRYQKAVRRAMEKGAAQPMLLSEYLEGNRARRASRDDGSALRGPSSSAIS
jgi:hypothetical protein